jgi:high-affinity iron transporter
MSGPDLRKELACSAVGGVLFASAVLALSPTAGATAHAPEPIVITRSACAPSWATPRPGRDTFAIEDHTARHGAIYLFNPYTGLTVAARTGLQPGATETLHVLLKPGNYTWSCYMKGAAVRQSVDVMVHSPPVMTAAGPTTEIPVSKNQLAGPIQSYRTYVSQQLGLLETQVAQLRVAIAGGQLGQAEAAWLTAHLTWQRLGAAYDAFGNLGTMIDGLAPGLDVGQTPGTPSGSGFEGFHKVELDLWGEQDLTAAAADADQLAVNVATLVAQFPHEPIPAAELPLRTHEILEDSMRDELSGADDYGSGTDMASVEADVDGTEVLLHLLAPLLKERAPDLVTRATAQLDRLDAALAATEQDGHWVAVSQVPLAQREQVDGAIGAALEILAIVPDVMPILGSTL